jgi:hypothetical protein
MEISFADKRSYLVKFSKTEYKFLLDLTGENGGTTKETLQNLIWGNLMMDHVEHLHSKAYDIANERYGGD